jgi:hypothetical protein
MTVQPLAPSLSNEWIADLLDYVGREFVSPRFDREAFAHDMRRLAFDCWAQSVAGSHHRWLHKEQKDAIEVWRRISELSTELLKIFEARADPELAYRSEQDSSDLLPSWSGLQLGLGRLSHVAQSIGDQAAESNTRFKPSLSATDRIIHMAAAVFENHFKRKAGISRSNGVVGGPFVRFCQALNPELTGESIAKSRGKLRHGKSGAVNKA